MADKMTDRELAAELKRFGEEVKLPIEGRKRPILIKKLNHYKAKENPPPKRSRSGGRQPKRSVAPPEFSDDSQDETETEPKRIFHRKKQNNSSTSAYEPERRSLRNRSTESSSMTVPKSGRGKGLLDVNSRVTAVKQMEIYPNEFSDTDDTADESVYEVENKSINTTFNFDSVENEDEEDISPSPKWSRTGQYSSRRVNTSLINDKSAHSNLSNHNFSSALGKGMKENHDESIESREYTVSSTILTVVAVFFIVLAVSYVYIRRDIFLPHMTATLQSDLKDSKIELCENQSCTNYTEEEVRLSLQIINSLHDELASLKGKFELGDISEQNVRLQRSAVENYVTKVKTSLDKPKLFNLIYHLVLKHPEWDIRVFDNDGTQAEKVSEVQQFEAVYGDLSLPRRLLLALYKVIYGVIVFCLVVLACVLGIFFLRWQNRRKEREQKKVYELVEKIIDILKENCELAERKDDPKNYPAYMAVQHIRDQLIPVSKRKQMQALWDEAVRFIEANESRIRVETQIIQGEEFTVWRWLQTFPNGGRMWQGQAFGESSRQNSVNTLPYGPTPCLKVRNMFDSNMEQNTDDWHIDIEDAILEKCKNNNGILHIFVDRTSKEGCVYIKCSSCEKAYEAYQSLHGWWFDGRLVTVKYLRLEHYHDRFPDSRNKKYPMRPSNNDMQSVSRPYHRSALEMT